MNMTIERRLFGVRSGQRARGLRLGLLGLACLAAVSVAASAQTYIEFNAPGVLGEVGGDTFPVSINTGGTIVGYYVGTSPGSSDLEPGFVRSAAGTITSFNAGKSIAATIAAGINSAGVITGYWQDPDGVDHGFILPVDAKLESFDVPGAGTNSAFGTVGTVPEGINTAGVIAGYYIDASVISHGFVRSGRRSITSFDAPGAYRTFAFSINTGGAIAGYYTDANQVNHGFVRSTDGAITSFDAPGVGTNGTTGLAQGTLAFSINDNGAIVGYYTDASGGFHGFVRSAGGTISTLDAPGAGTGQNPLTGVSQGTMAQSINNAGVIVGYFNDPNGLYHGFMVSASGAITSLEDAPGAGTESNEGTFPISINDNGVIVGHFTDEGFFNEGFQLTP